MSKRKLATIRPISSISPIEGADFIELVRIDGWQCVSKKGEFQVGSPCVYFEVDSFLPIEPRYEFLRKSSYRKFLDKLEGRRNEGFRLKTAKFRKQLSQGLALSLDAFKGSKKFKVTEEGFLSHIDGKTYGVGSDVSELLNVEKYEPPVPASLAGQIKGMFPAFVKKTDEERIQNLPDYFDTYKDQDFECSEKLDGSSMTVYLNDGDFGVCSRNLDLLEDNKNTFWKLTGTLELKVLLNEIGRNLALQGEAVGESIQKNPLKIKGQRLYLFNIWDIDQRTYLPSEQRLEIFDFLSKRVPIKHVPLIAEKIKIFEKYSEMTQLLDFATGISLVNSKVYREGVVFKASEATSVGVISFKAISNKYLLKHGG